MPKVKSRVCKLNYTYLQAIGIALILCLVGLLLWHGNVNSYQAASTIMAQVRFQGEYRISDGPWQKIVDGEHIPSTQGDVTLRGNFHMLAPDGEYVGIYDGDIPIALYTDHINITIYDGENEPDVIEAENPLFGVASCGIRWTAYTFTNTEPIELLIHNPHCIGNETAIDALLSNMALWANIDFEKGVLDNGEFQRNTGLSFMLVALALLGIALFSTLIHSKNSKLLWLLGLVILFAGIYFTYSASGVSFWSESIVTNTVAVGSAIMLYMLFLSMVIVCFLNFSKKVGVIAVICLSVADALFFALPMITDLYLYDTLCYWVVLQLIANVILLGCIIKDCSCKKSKSNWGYIGAILPLIAFGIDVVMTVNGNWKGGVLSGYTFVALFVTVMVVVLRIIPRGINDAAKAKELETEKNALKAQLAENRISIMLSQMQPHFIHNVLNVIYYMCGKNPTAAQEAISKFSDHLRNNLEAISQKELITFRKEMDHIRTYLELEQIRFGDELSIVYDIEEDSFLLPVLSIQPLVENAVKHGISKKRGGGIVTISSYQTADAYQVTVADTGVGFDINQYVDDGKVHVGLMNVKQLLTNRVDATVDIVSAIGNGTTVTVTIPKKEASQ